MRTFTIPKLEMPIDKGSYKLDISNLSIKLKLKKRYKLDWKRLDSRKKALKDINFKKQAEFEENQKKDPLKNIFSMLEGLYKSGDDEMKQMISKAWAKSEEKHKNNN